MRQCLGALQIQAARNWRIFLTMWELSRERGNNKWHQIPKQTRHLLEPLTTIQVLQNHYPAKWPASTAVVCNAKAAHSSSTIKSRCSKSWTRQGSLVNLISSMKTTGSHHNPRMPKRQRHHRRIRNELKNQARPPKVYHRRSLRESLFKRVTISSSSSWSSSITRSAGRSTPVSIASFTMRIPSLRV